MDPENKIKLYEPAVRKWERLRPTPAVRAEPLEMKESADLLAYWRGLRQRRRTILKPVFFFFSGVALGTPQQKHNYPRQAPPPAGHENTHKPTRPEGVAVPTCSVS